MSDSLIDAPTSDAGTGAAAGTSGDVGASSAPGTDFLASLPEDIRSESSLANIKDVSTLAKGYVNAQRMIGSSIRIPGEDASPESKKDFMDKLSKIPGVAMLPDDKDPASLEAFYNKLGRPENPEGYELKVEGLELDNDLLGQFKAVAHKLGLTKAQAEAVVQFGGERDKAIMAHVEQEKTASKAALEKEWGSEYKTRMFGVKAVLDVFGKKYPDAIQSLKTSPLLNNAGLLIMLSELGKMYTESGVISANSGLKFGMTSQEAREKITEIRTNMSHPFHNASDPGHGAAVEKVNQLSQIAYPEHRES